MADVTVRVKQITEGSRDVSRFGDRLKSTLTTVAKLGAAAAVTGVAIKKALDLGEAGAVVKQTEASFERLNRTVFKTPGLLKEMQQASNRTVSDVGLMSAALTITAGTSGDMSQALARATPQIVEMAKAANTINPALGSTTFLLDSLSIAAKRQSRLLADNAGIIVRMDSAIREVHPALQDLAGTYEELPDELRFLNEMLHQGANLIDAAGGAAESAVDPYQKLKVTFAELADEGRGLLDSVLRPIVIGLNESIEAADTLTRARQRGLITESEQIALARQGATATNESGQSILELIEARLKSSDAAFAAADAEDAVRAAMSEVTEATLQASDATLAYEERREGIFSVEGWKAQQEAIAEVEQEAADLARTIDSIVVGAIETNRDTIGNLADAYADLEDAQGSWVVGTISTATDVNDINAELAADLSGDQTEAMGEILDTVEEGSREWLNAYGALQNDLTETQRQELVARRADLEAQHGEMTDVFTGNLEEQRKAEERIAELNQELGQSYGEMMVDIISATDGFDEVAANFAVASGTMTETQAEMILRAEEVGTALGEVATAVDEQAISAEQGAQIYAGLVQASTDLDVDIDAALSKARQTIQRFASGDWIQVGDTFTKMLDPAVTAEGEGPVGQVEFKVDDQELDRLREKLGLVSGDVAGINETVVAPLTSPEAIEHMKEISGDTMENLASVNDNSPYAAEIIGNIEETDSRAQGLLNKIFQIEGEHTVTFNIQTRGSIPSGPGFQHGGSFTVGGSGGPDSQMVAFMASPGERVDVSPQGRHGGPGGGGAVWTGDLIVQGGNPDDVVRALEDRGIISRTRLR